MVPTSSTTSRTPPGRDGSAPDQPDVALIAEVELAVRSVLARQGPACRGSEAEVFAERLFALRHAEVLPGATREVQVAAGTVVTPLARDLLKKRGIVIRVVSRTELARVKPASKWGFAIDEPAESGTIAALRRLLLEGDWT